MSGEISRDDLIVSLLKIARTLFSSNFSEDKSRFLHFIVDLGLPLQLNFVFSIFFLVEFFILLMSCFYTFVTEIGMRISGDIYYFFIILLLLNRKLFLSGSGCIDVMIFRLTQANFYSFFKPQSICPLEIYSCLSSKCYLLGGSSKLFITKDYLNGSPEYTLNFVSDFR